MSDRLQDLLRQRAAIAQHLAWLDREIAAQGSPAINPPAGAPATPVAAPASAALSPAPGIPPAPVADEWLARLRQEESSQGQLSKRGCWMIFLAALLLIGAVLGGLVYLRYA